MNIKNSFYNTSFEINSTFVQIKYSKFIFFSYEAYQLEAVKL